MRFHHPALIAALAAVYLCSAPAQGAQWQKLAATRGEKVELDLSRVTPMDNGRVQAWSRLALGKAVDDAESGTTYNVVEVLNSYDCGNQRYAPVKRLYLSGETVLKAEPIYGARDQAAKSGVEAAVLKEVCRSRTVASQGAGRNGNKSSNGGKAAAEEQGDNRFSVMHAELVTNGKDGQVRPITVSEKSADGAKAEPPKRMIDLPKIDPSQVEKPTDIKAAEAAKGAEKGGEKVAGKPMDKTPESKLESKPVEKMLVQSRPASVAASVDSLNGIDRRTRELALATTGPRRVVRKPAKEDEAAHAHAQIHWSYEGEGGPANWAKLEDKNALCATGKRQSPIDIGEGIKVDLEGIRFDYKPTQFRIEDNGHTIQVTPAEGNTIKIMGRVYELKQFHFHRPSEEKVGGKRFDMVVHLVHKDDDGNLAVVAVLLEKGEQEQAVIQTLWNNMPLEPGSSLSPTTPIDLLKLLPADRAYYTYMGSLTTPPCSEGVLWMVFKQPVIVTQDQVSIFSRLYKNNARPIQPGFGRLVKESR